MAYLHEAQIANIVTSYCTCLAGIMPMLFTVATRPQPARWFFVYFCTLLTGIPTVYLHANEGDRFASFLDVGSNIVLAWALQIAVAGDFMPRRRCRTFVLASTLINAAVVAWLLYEVFAPTKIPIIRFGGFGQFYAGEVALIANAWVVVFVFGTNYRRIPHEARPLLLIVIVMFFIGMLLATAGNSTISFGIFPWHAVWHIVGAFGFITLWLFNYVRFNCAMSSEESK
ncbi:MAG: hypothetical protein K1Y02_15325 [Candidatus Hydrogenedentes bacterium]|nr:hypothetical protein [Candidatus Hydrogenedentota bacterium]